MVRIEKELSLDESKEFLTKYGAFTDDEEWMKENVKGYTPKANPDFDCSNELELSFSLLLNEFDCLVNPFINEELSHNINDILCSDIIIGKNGVCINKTICDLHRVTLYFAKTDTHIRYNCYLLLGMTRINIEHTKYANGEELINVVRGEVRSDKETISCLNTREKNKDSLINVREYLVDVNVILNKIWYEKTVTKGDYIKLKQKK